MTWKQIALWIVLADFVAFTGYTVAMEGLTAFVPISLAFASESLWGLQILWDFLLALSIALGWVIADARQRGIAWWPAALLTLTLGSIGPLSYLIVRERREQAASRPSGAAVAARAS